MDPIEDQPAENSEDRPTASSGDPSPPSASEQKEAPQTETEQKTVLLADDSPVDQIKFEELLQRLGFNVILAGNGHMAIGILEQSKPDLTLIILDVVMPIKGGIQALDEIRAIKEYRTTPIVMLTGKDDPRMVRAALKRGPTDYILKSSTPEEIEDRLKRFT